MSEYTPTTEEIIKAWRFFRTENRAYDGDAEAEVRSWLAAHDAEVRAGVVAEEPEDRSLTPEQISALPIGSARLAVRHPTSRVAVHGRRLRTSRQLRASSGTVRLQPPSDAPVGAGEAGTGG